MTGYNIEAKMPRNPTGSYIPRIHLILFYWESH